MSKLSTPVREFKLSCEVLLTDTFTRNTLTKEELHILQTCLQRLTEKFSSLPRDEMNPGQPIMVPPVILPHGTGGPVE